MSDPTTSILAQLPAGVTAQGTMGGNQQHYSDANGTYVQNEYNVGQSNYGSNYTFTPNPVSAPANLTADNQPSTSAHVAAGTAINSATIDATTPVTPPDTSNFTAAQNWLMTPAGGGYSAQDANDMYSTLADRQAANTAFANYNGEQTSLNSQNSAENSSWQNIQNQIASSKGQEISAATSKLYSANPYAALGSGTGETDAINTKRTTIEANASALHTSAMANIAQGNLTAAAKNLSDLNTMMSNATTQANTIANDKAIRDQQTATLANTTKNDALTKATAMLQTLNSTTPAAVSIMAADSSTDPSNNSSLMTALNNTPGFKELLAGGYTPQEALGVIQNSLTGNKQTIANQKIDQANQKIQIEQTNSAIALNKANAYMANMQANLALKQVSAIDAQTIASVSNGAFLDASYELSTSLSKTQIPTLVTALTHFAQSGNTPATVANMKTTLTNAVIKSLPTTLQSTIKGIQDTASAAIALQQKIDALPASQKSGFVKGTLQDWMTKIGQNQNPALQEIAAEANHLNALYKANVFGKRTVATSIPGLDNLLGSSKDSASLNYSDITAFGNTANDAVNGVTQSALSPATYQAIYGSTAATPAAGATPFSWSSSVTSIANKYGITIK